jgi:hypothetical protein
MKIFYQQKRYIRLVSTIYRLNLILLLFLSDPQTVLSKLSKFPFSNCQSFTFQTVKFSLSKLSNFHFPNCQIFTFQTVNFSLFKLSNFHFPNCQNFPFQTVKFSLSKLSKFPFPNCQNFPFKTVKLSRLKKFEKHCCICTVGRKRRRIWKEDYGLFRKSFLEATVDFSLETFQVLLDFVNISHPLFNFSEIWGFCLQAKFFE